MTRGSEVAPQAGGTETRRLPSQPFAVADSRRILAAALSQYDLPTAVVEDALVVVSELVGNAVTHGASLSSEHGGLVELAWSVSNGSIYIWVTDGGGDQRPLLREPDLLESGGRGLKIVNALADEWGVDVGDDGEVTVNAVVSNRGGEDLRPRRQRYARPRAD